MFAGSGGRVGYNVEVFDILLRVIEGVKCVFLRRCMPLYFWI